MTKEELEFKWMSPEEFGKVSKSRNPIIASLLARTIYVEKMGTGIKRMRDAMKEEGLPEPVFDQSPHSFYITFKDDFFSDMSEKTSEKTSEKIIILLKETPSLTIEELSSRIGVTTRSIERNVKKLQEKGLLKRIGPDKGGYWEVL
ncbi:MAG: HTH domain-containing protein [Spirochaetales bacterium]|nr:HTH domain-containing protein [Spirochaetales bacterium]